MKEIVARHLHALETGAPTDVPIYHGVKPFDADATETEVWAGIRAAFGPLRRRLDILIEGPNLTTEVAPGAGGLVVAMGQVLACFEAPWIGIRSSGRLVHLPFVAFYRVEDDSVTEVFEFLDILSVMTQAGQNHLAHLQTGAQIMAPGPATHDGLGPHDPGESVKTHALCQAMLDDLITDLQSPVEHLERFWHPDMTWFGPAGIGASITIDGYRKGHTGPWEERLTLTDHGPCLAGVAEGQFAAYCWRPGPHMQSLGGFLGLPPGKTGEIRVVDVYRRAGGKLAENWIFIDMLHFLAMQGVDLLNELEKDAP